jgi:hypothetical protein
VWLSVRIGGRVNWSFRQTRLCVLLASSCLVETPALAVDSTWISLSNTGWNNNANWTPDPSGNGGTAGPTTSDTATFANNGAVTSVLVSAAVTPTGIFFGVGAPSFTITINQDLSLGSAGIVNNSGVAQYFTVSSGASFTLNASSSLADATVTKRRRAESPKYRNGRHGAHHQ